MHFFLLTRWAVIPTRKVTAMQVVTKNLFKKTSRLQHFHISRTVTSQSTNGSGDLVWCAYQLRLVQHIFWVWSHGLLELVSTLKGIPMTISRGSRWDVGGKTIESYVTGSNNGSITCTILTNKNIVVLDGHKSTFQLLFLDSISHQPTT